MSKDKDYYLNNYWIFNLIYFLIKNKKPCLLIMVNF